MFKKKISSIFIDINDSELIEKKQAETLNLQEKLNKFIHEKSILQNKFDFVIPDYIIDEIIEIHETKSPVNLNYLINCAVINGQLSKENGSILKQTYLS